MKNIIPIGIMILLIISSFSYLTVNKQDPLVNNEKEIANWITEYDPTYKSKVIWADRGPIFTWYLKKEVIYVNWVSKPKLSKDMANNNTSYYISNNPNIFLYNYSKIKTIGEVSVYKKREY